MTKNWYRKRNAAHWILAQLVPNKFAVTGEDKKFKHTPEGGIEWDEATGKEVFRYAYLSLNLRDLSKLTNKYTIKQLSDAKDILFLNGHIEIMSTNDKDFYDVSFKTNDAGRVAFEDNQYKQQKIEQRYKEITNISNWLTPILTFIVSVIALFISCNQCLKNENAQIIIATKNGDNINNEITNPFHSNHQPDSLNLKDSGR